MSKPLIAITMGDPAGVGPEVCLQLLANAEVRELQKAARQERIQKLIAQADLNPDWVFDKMDATEQTCY